jgi:hypothetical protein
LKNTHKIIRGSKGDEVRPPTYMFACMKLEPKEALSIKKEKLILIF